MKNTRTKTKWVVLAGFCAFLGFAASASAGEAEVWMDDKTVPEEGYYYRTCGWNGAWVKGAVWVFSGGTRICTVEDWHTWDTYATSPCNTSGYSNLWMATGLSTWNTSLCSDDKPISSGLNYARCGGTYDLRRCNFNWEEWKWECEGCAAHLLDNKVIVDVD